MAGHRLPNRKAKSLLMAKRFYVICGNSAKSGKALEVSLLGVVRNGAPSRKVCVVKGQTTKASNKTRTPPPPARRPQWRTADTFRTAPPSDSSRASSRRYWSRSPGNFAGREGKRPRWRCKRSHTFPTAKRYEVLAVADPPVFSP